jgi:hypothetical protein
MADLPAPRIGSIVHYAAGPTPGGEYGRQCVASLVMEVDVADPQHVGLALFSPNLGAQMKQLFNGGVHAEHQETAGPAGRTAGTWHWPEEDVTS